MAMFSYSLYLSSLVRTILNTTGGPEITPRDASEKLLLRVVVSESHETKNWKGLLTDLKGPELLAGGLDHSYRTDIIFSRIPWSRIPIPRPLKILVTNCGAETKRQGKTQQKVMINSYKYSPGLNFVGLIIRSLGLRSQPRFTIVVAGSPPIEGTRLAQHSGYHRPETWVQKTLGYDPI
ncbi:hypothetical protein BGX38DRAFT_1140356 [Terfezia claveryi]|nr:hypothetical protein BGX38DRAFT_1140356 [Terfezia claveryi]